MTDTGFSKDMGVISDIDNSIIPLGSYLFINKLKVKEISNAVFPKWVPSRSSYLQNNQANTQNEKKKQK